MKTVDVDVVGKQYPLCAAQTERVLEQVGENFSTFFFLLVKEGREVELNTHTHTLSLSLSSA